MGDSSEGVSSAHETHLQEYDGFKFIDDGDSVGDDAASETNALLKSTVASSYRLNNKVLSNGDQSISSDLLSKPVPPKREGDTNIEDTNGHNDDFAEREPIVSLSMIRGKQANGFDEVALIESEEDVTSSKSDSWCEEDLTDNDSSETELVRIGDERHQIYEDIISSEPGESRVFGEFEDLKTGRPLNGGSSNVHKKLYSPKSRNEDFVGYGENMASYNYPTRCSGNNKVYPTDTYETISSTFRGMSCSPFPTMTGSRLNASSICVPPTAPRPSLSSPIVSGGFNSRHQLPYETAPQPPFGKRLDEPRLRNSAVGLLGSTQDRIVSPRGMPKAEPIGVAESMSSISAIDAETSKKKKKKKKRNGGGMKGDSDAADKKSPLRDEGNVVAPATYPHSLDAGAPVMDHEQRNKPRNKGGKKKKAENVFKARDILGNRGSDDVDTLVGYVEGGRKKAPGGGTQEKKGRRQRQTGRINGERLDEEEEEKVQEVQKVEITRQNERKDEEVKEKEDYDLEFTNFEELVDAEEEMPFEKYVGRRKKVRGPGSGKPVSQPTPTPAQPSRGPAARWGTRAFARPPVRPPPPAPRPPPAKEEFPPLRAPTQTLTKISWNFQQVQHFLETLYPGEKEKCSFYSDAGRKAHHLPPPTLSS